MVTDYEYGCKYHNHLGRKHAVHIWDIADQSAMDFFDFCHDTSRTTVVQNLQIRTNAPEPVKRATAHNFSESTRKVGFPVV